VETIHTVVKLFMSQLNWCIIIINFFTLRQPLVLVSCNYSTAHSEMEMVIFITNYWIMTLPFNSFLHILLQITVT
jgi:hypothetical protein